MILQICLKNIIQGREKGVSTFLNCEQHTYILDHTLQCSFLLDTRIELQTMDKRYFT